MKDCRITSFESLREALYNKANVICLIDDQYTIC